MHGIGGLQQPELLVQTIELHALVLVAIGQLGQQIVHTLIAAPHAEDGNEHRHRRESCGPRPPQAAPRPKRRGFGYAWRLGRDGPHQALFGARRRLRATARQAQQSQVAPQRLQFTTAGGAGVQVLLQFLTFGASQFAQCVERQVVGELFVRPHHANFARNCCRPLRMRVLMVPRGSPVFSAISECVSP